MDFSNNAFRPSPSHNTLSDDTMNHAKLVMACRFGWSAGPDNTAAQTPLTPAPTPLAPSVNTWGDSRTKRFAPCRGRLYHQLTCSHKIRTDLVGDCGPNCLDPYGNPSDVPFYCQECVEKESREILEARLSQHNANYPPMDQMSKEEYEQWYDEHRRLHAQFLQDRSIFEFELKAKTRATNLCSQIEASKDELNFAAEIDSLSLAMASSNESCTRQTPTRTTRVNLPSDASEQLHWGLNSLALDRGSCGMEYSPSRPSQNSRSNLHIDEDL